MNMKQISSVMHWILVGLYAIMVPIGPLHFMLVFLIPQKCELLHSEIFLWQAYSHERRKDHPSPTHHSILSHW
jgi:hypothetical protein